MLWVYVCGAAWRFAPDARDGRGPEFPGQCRGAAMQCRDGKKMRAVAGEKDTG